MVNRRSFFKKVGVGAAGLALAPRLFSLDGGEFEPMRGLGYGPFRDGQAPGAAYPTQAQMRSDIVLMKDFTGKIRTYGVENSLFHIPRICNEEGLDVYPGAWIGTGTSGNNSQINSLISIANAGYSRVKGLTVGNEVLLRNDQSPTSLINYIRQVKTQTSQPVTTFEPWWKWDQNPNNLVDEVDYISAGIYSYWDGVSNSQAVDYVLGRYNLLKNKYPGKEIVIGETGLPSSGPVNGGSVPGVEAHRQFTVDFAAAAAQNNIDYFFFEAFDENWKDEGGVGAHWGVCEENRIRKTGLLQIMQDKLHLSNLDLSNFPNNSVDVGTFEGNRYDLESSTNLTDWSYLQNFYGAGATNKTKVPFNSTNDKLFIRAKEF